MMMFYVELLFQLPIRPIVEERCAWTAAWNQLIASNRYDEPQTETQQAPGPTCQGWARLTNHESP
jgi:hypothetical protein